MIGVEDGTRKIIGVTDKEIEEIYESFSDALYEAVTPVIIPELFVRNFEGVNLVIIRIYPGAKKPYFIKSEGGKKGVYIRIGSTTRAATQEYIEELLREQSRIAFDHEPCEALPKSLNAQLLQRVYRKNLTQDLQLKEQIFVRGDKDQMRPTKAAVLMFHQQPERFIPEAQIICTQFTGPTGRNVVQTRELKGSIPDLIDEAVRLTEKWAERKDNYATIRTKGNPLVPTLALREAITNALLHRKYTLPGPIKISIYQDYLEILSPGSFPGPISPKNVGDGSTYLRNSLLVKFARKAGLVEKMGSGIRLMLSLCDDYNLNRPEFSEDGDYVKVTFRFETVIQTIDIESAIEKLLQEKPILSIADVRPRVVASRNTITTAFNRMIAKGVVKRTGTGRGTRYIPASAAKKRSADTARRGR